MEMMTMNMMMELDNKLPDHDPFSIPNFQDFPYIEFPGGCATNTDSPPPIYHRPPPPPPPPPQLLTTPSLITPNSYSIEGMREMIFQMAAMQPVQIDPESLKPPIRRKNVKISRDPQSVAARRRRERISERIRVLQRLVPGGTKMDTASMLDEAVHYMKFLKKQVQSLEEQGASNNMSTPITTMGGWMGTLGYPTTTINYSAFPKACGQVTPSQMVGSMQILR